MYGNIPYRIHLWLNGLKGHFLCVGDNKVYLIVLYHIVSYRTILYCIVSHCIVSYHTKVEVINTQYFVIQ